MNRISPYAVRILSSGCKQWRRRGFNAEPLEWLRKCIEPGDASNSTFAIGTAIRNIDYYREMVNTGNRARAGGISTPTGPKVDTRHGDDFLCTDATVRRLDVLWGESKD